MSPRSCALAVVSILLSAAAAAPAGAATPDRYDVQFSTTGGAQPGTAAVVTVGAKVTYRYPGGRQTATDSGPPLPAVNRVDLVRAGKVLAGTAAATTLSGPARRPARAFFTIVLLPAGGVLRRGDTAVAYTCPSGRVDRAGDPHCGAHPKLLFRVSYTGRPSIQACAGDRTFTGRLDPGATVKVDGDQQRGDSTRTNRVGAVTVTGTTFRGSSRYAYVAPSTQGGGFADFLTAITRVEKHARDALGLAVRSSLQYEVPSCGG